VEKNGGPDLEGTLNEILNKKKDIPLISRGEGVLAQHKRLASPATRDGHENKFVKISHARQSKKAIPIRFSVKSGKSDRL